MSEETGREAFLYIGLDLASITQDNYPEFRSFDLIPLSWYLLFDEKDIKTRQEVMPESLSLFQGEFASDPDFEMNFSEFINEPVAFETTIPLAQERLHRFRKLFEDIPYFWSYFRVIDILIEQLEDQIAKIAEVSMEEAVPVIETYHPDVTDSQVKVKKESQDEFDLSIDDLTAFANVDFRGSDDDSVLEDESLLHDMEETIFAALAEDKPKEPVDMDNPFAELELMDEPTVVSEPVVESTDTGFDDSLMDTLNAALQLDQISTDRPEVVVEEEDDGELQSAMYITAKFDHLAIEGYGKRIRRIFNRIENLYHHIKREEGRITRIMIDIFQDIFRESLSNWRITGLLSEDFVQGDPSRLGAIMIGNPSAFNVKSSQTFDLEYWTKKTLQLGDEKLMYTLSKLPSEELHPRIENGEIIEISDIIDKTLLLTKSKKIPRFTKKNLAKKPRDSNIWGIRVLIPYRDKHIPATILCQSPDTTWEEDFTKRLDLPGVLNDWNIDYLVRFSEFSHTDTYQIIFKRARGRDEAYQGFLRWIRRHHSMYVSTYGVDGTIKLLKRIILETQKREEGQMVFTILTNLSQLGFDTAIEVLNDENVMKRLSWIYSSF